MSVTRDSRDNSEVSCPTGVTLDRGLSSALRGCTRCVTHAANACRTHLTHAPSDIAHPDVTRMTHAPPSSSAAVVLGARRARVHHGEE